MLYGYQVTEEFVTSAVFHNLSVSATHGDAAALGTRKGPNLVTLTGAISAQSAGNAHNNRGRVQNASGANVASMIKSASAHVNHQTNAGASANAAHATPRTWRATTPPNLGVAAISVFGFGHTIPQHVVVAASHSGRFASLLKQAAPAGYSVAGSETISMLRGIGRALTGAASAETAGLARTPGIGRGASDPQSVLMLRGIGRRFLATSGEAASIITFRGKVLKGASSEAAKLVRSAGKILLVTSAEALGSPLGVRTFGRIYGVAATYSAAVARAMSSHYHAVSSSGASVLRGSGKHYGAASGESSAAQRGIGSVRSAASANSASIKRTTGLPFGIAASAIVAVAYGTRRILSSRQAFDAQTASIQAPIVRAKSLTASDGEAAHLSTHTTKILPEAVSVASAQAVAAVRKQLSAIRSTFSGNVAAALKCSGLVRLISMRGVAAVAAPAVRPKVVAATSSETPLLIRSRVKVLLAADANTAFVRYSRGHPASASQGNSSFLVKLVAKIIQAADSQSPGLGRGIFRLFRTSNPQAFTTYTPHGRILGASHGQSSSVTPWYHLFVAPWAQQQTTFLPPAGGLAEPPYFAPVDPSDQTTFAFDWSARAAPGDPIVAATVTCVPPGFSFFGPVFINGLLVEVTALPFTPLSLPTTYSLRCTATFASGSRSSFSIPVRVQNL
jgi:hypothetical protein